MIYGELRARILSRKISLTDSLDVGVLARELDTLPATVYHAVTKLVADGLLMRDGDRGYVVRPVTRQSFRGGLRRAVHDGAGRLRPQQWATWRRNGLLPCAT